MNYSFLADAVLLVHFAIVLFVVAGLLLIAVGNAVHWRWVNGWWFRALHLLAIGIVVAESWLGIECPLTTLENWLRIQAGQGNYLGSFIQYWVHGILFYQAPRWVFTLAYTLFAFAVVVAWWRWPPVQVRD
ncbi:uncharacterized protein DUF2784 [Limnobacter thiooxidans]|uniref:DUF2784 domain-containing protein n=1 Tax=Limnobacter thiooxidans TaxID=131080 RepID=A0AA86JLL7_9BURK|nr:uncharacterized protein DUF2784 [Limnobacter thiooxidans]BET26887.1 DUF2784 domain-containing protein [Limnobacter thiooxidans]